MKKILMASLVPFWNRSTGAEERIFCLVDALTKANHHLTTFYPLPTSAADEIAWKQYGLNVESRTSDQRPTQWLNQLRWHQSAIANGLGKLIRQAPENLGPDPYTDLQPATTLGDYHWRWAVTAFREFVDDLRPDVILCQYITTAYLLSGLPPKKRAKLHCMIDTHDCLSLRGRQFTQQGNSHWLQIGEKEEAEVLRNFDSIVAIEHSEAVTFENMAPQSRVLVAGHRAIVEQATPKQHESNVANAGRLSVGYLASHNASNVDALRRFLTEVWSVVGQADGMEMVVAGDICNAFRLGESETLSNLPEASRGSIRFLGRVDHVAQFYQRIDVAVNPVQFGTGLKIKSAEALAYGVPLLTTEIRDLALAKEHRQSESVSSESPEGDGFDPLIYCEKIKDMILPLQQLHQESEELQRLKKWASQHATDHPLSERPYMALLDAVAQS